MDNVNDQCDLLLVEALSRETKWIWMEKCLVVWNDYNVILIIKVKIIIFEKIHDEGWFQLSTLNRRSEVL